MRYLLETYFPRDLSNMIRIFYHADPWFLGTQPERLKTNKLKKFLYLCARYQDWVGLKMLCYQVDNVERWPSLLKRVYHGAIDADSPETIHYVKEKLFPRLGNDSLLNNEILFMACRAGKWPFIEHALDEGATRIEYGIQGAIFGDQVPILNLLEALGNSMDHREGFAWACKYGKKKSMLYYLSKKPKIRIKNVHFNLVEGHDPSLRDILVMAMTMRDYPYVQNERIESGKN